MIHNTEQNPHANQPAGLMPRMAVMFYDGLLLLAVLFFGTALWLPFTGGEAISAGESWYSLYLLVLAYLYFAWCWTHGGQTLGMKCWKVRLTQHDGQTLTWSHTAKRFAGSLISWAPMGLGYLWALFDKDKLMWHDHLSGTRLVRNMHP